MTLNRCRMNRTFISGLHRCVLFLPDPGCCLLAARRLRLRTKRPDADLADPQDPAQYADCVVPKLQSSALNPTVSQTQRSYRIVVPSKVSADNVLEAYKAGNGGKVFIYERHLLASNFLPSSFERAAQDCI